MDAHNEPVRYWRERDEALEAGDHLEAELTQEARGEQVRGRADDARVPREGAWPEAPEQLAHEREAKGDVLPARPDREALDGLRVVSEVQAMLKGQGNSQYKLHLSKKTKCNNPTPQK